MALDISIDKDETEGRNISVLRNHLGTELFLGVGIKRSKIMFSKILSCLIPFDSKFHGDFEYVDGIVI